MKNKRKKSGMCKQHKDMISQAFEKQGIKQFKKTKNKKKKSVLPVYNNPDLPLGKID